MGPKLVTTRNPVILVDGNPITGLSAVSPADPSIALFISKVINGLVIPLTYLMGITISCRRRAGIVWAASFPNARIAKVRRSADLTGVQSATSRLLNSPLDDSGYVLPTVVKQVPFIANAIVEPDPSVKPINMLDHLPEEDSVFYSLEEHVIERSGKSFPDVC